MRVGFIFLFFIFNVQVGFRYYYLLGEVYFQVFAVQVFLLWSGVSVE